MLIYEKFVDGVRHIFGTIKNVPSDNDEQVSYLDEDRKPVEVTEASRFFDDGHGGMKDKDGNAVDVWLGDKNIIPGGKDGGDPSTACDMLSFKIGKIEGTITEADAGNTVAINVPSTVDVTKIKPTVKISPEATVSPASKEETDFTNPVTYTVTAEDGTHTKDYIVTVTCDE